MIALIAAVSCSNDEKENDTAFGIDNDEFEVPAEGATRTVNLSSLGNWSADPSEPWVKVSPANGSGSQQCVIQIDSTVLAEEDRSAVVRFTSTDDSEKRTLKITQKGFDKVLSLSQTSVALENYADYGERYFDISVVSNVDFTVNIPDSVSSWLSYEPYSFELDCGARPRKVTIRFDWEGNDEAFTRSTVVSFTPVDDEVENLDSLSITQDRAPEITPDHKGDSLALVIIDRKLGAGRWDKSEPLRNWYGVTLWEEKDEGYTPDKDGRVKGLRYSMFFTREGIPDEFKYLTEMETLYLFSNGNVFMWSFSAGTAIAQLTNLKSLTLGSIGLTEFPDDYKNLKNLEYLDLSGNNFQTLPDVLTQENFPKLRYLNLVANRRYATTDLTQETHDKSMWGGFYSEGSYSLFQRLLSWSNLRTLKLSNNLIKGTIPSYISGVPRWTREELMANDTTKNAVNYLVNQPKVLPNCTDLSINLNYLYGTLPRWLLYHPHLIDWSPDVLVFNQNSEPDDTGRIPGFSNVPESSDYYYEAYPIYKDE